MRIQKSYITLDDVRFYSYHGVMEQERKVGNSFLINLRLRINNMQNAIRTDNVDDTVSYAEVHKILAEEMTIPSNLLEHVCGRIIERIFKEFPAVDEIQIKLSKQNPPMGADIDSASVKLNCSRF